MKFFQENLQKFCYDFTRKFLQKLYREFFFSKRSFRNYFQNFFVSFSGICRDILSEILSGITPGVPSNCFFFLGILSEVSPEIQSEFFQKSSCFNSFFSEHLQNSSSNHFGISFYEFITSSFWEYQDCSRTSFPSSPRTFSEIHSLFLGDPLEFTLMIGNSFDIFLQKRLKKILQRILQSAFGLQT